MFLDVFNRAAAATPPHSGHLDKFLRAFRKSLKATNAAAAAVVESVAAPLAAAAAAGEMASGERGRSRVAHCTAAASISKVIKAEEQVVVVARKRPRSLVDNAAAIIPVGDNPCHEVPAG